MPERGIAVKNIAEYIDEKYDSDEYTLVAPGIYQKGDEYVTSLSFEQEPEYGEGTDSTDISQYPLEDILDTYFVSVSDYYEAKNSQATSECYLEFCSDDMDDVKGLRTIIGRHVCNVEKTVNGKKFIALEIE